MVQTALVTGGGAGMGKAIALRMAREDRRVGVLDINGADAASTAAAIAAACAYFVSDDAGYVTGQLLGVNGGTAF